MKKSLGWLLMIGIVLCTLFHVYAQRNDRTEKIQIGDLQRDYIVHVPPNRQEDSLVLAFHGGYGQASGMPRLTGLNELADHEGFIVVYPDGIRRHWNDGRSTIPDDVDDVAFISKLIDHLSSQFRIDHNHVYATGISNGGFFSLRVACDLSDKIAAVASVAASMPVNRLDECKPVNPVSVFLLNGVEDPIVPYAGGTVKHRGRLGYGGEIVSASEAARYWAKLNGSLLTVRHSRISDKDPDDGTTIEADLYANGRAGTEVLLYAIKGAGHTWPGGMQYLPAFLIGRSTRDIDGSSEIWRFFKNHPRRPL